MPRRSRKIADCAVDELASQLTARMEATQDTIEGELMTRPPRAMPIDYEPAIPSRPQPAPVEGANRRRSPPVSRNRPPAQRLPTDTAGGGLRRRRPPARLEPPRELPQRQRHRQV